MQVSAPGLGRLRGGVSEWLRAFANLADEMEAAGYTPEQIDRIKALVKH